MKNKILIVIPAYNEEKTIGKVIKDLKKKNYKNIIVVNDGSVDNTKKIVEKQNILLYNHMINRGLGGALGTGIKAALLNNADVIVTFDADGQHSVNDIKNLIKPIIEKKADAVIGSRMLNPEGMPLIRKAYQWIANLITFLLFGVWTTDSQSGLRAFSRKAAEKIKIKTNRMEVSSEIVHEIGKNKLKFKEIPIKAIYTDYSLSKGQSFFTGIKTTFRLILRRIMG